MPDVAMKRKTKLILTNSLIAATAIVCYSPGLLALSPLDASVLRAGSSLFVGFLLLTGLGYGNYKILNEDPRELLGEIEDEPDLKTISDVLKSYEGGKFFGPAAKTVSEQIKRFDKALDRAKQEVFRRFPKGSMAREKYMSVLNAAQTTVFKNIITMVNRMKLFDEDEYERLMHYREDNIPDDIQEKQLDIYKQNMSLTEEAISKNETMILRLDTLSVEISKTGPDDSSETILDEIDNLTKEIKYYT